MILSLRSDRSSVVSHKYIKKSRTGCLKIMASLNIKNSKHQITNNKQYPNYKLQKIHFGMNNVEGRMTNGGVASLYQF